MTSSIDWGSVAHLPIGKPPSLKTPHNKADIPSEDDMGFFDPDNILYINMEAPGVAERFKERIKELEQMLQLTQQLATIHAGIQVRDRKAEGSLPSDDSKDSQWKRSQYRTRVLDTYFKDGVYAWMYNQASSTVDKRIDVEKSRFHWELLFNMLVGIVIPRPLVATLEAIFKGIGDTIEQSSFTGDHRTFWNMLQVYTYDEVQDDLRGCKYGPVTSLAAQFINLDKALRNIVYSLDQEMYTVVKRKSSSQTINVGFYFAQNNFAFNESTWRSLKPDVEKYIKDTGIGNITNPPTVPV